MDIGEIIRTIDGGIAISVMLIIGYRVERRVIAMEQKIFSILDYFMGKGGGAGG